VYCIVVDFTCKAVVCCRGTLDSTVMKLLIGQIGIQNRRYGDAPLSI